MQNSGRVTKDLGTDWKTTNRQIYNLLTHSPHLLDLAGYLVGPIEKVRATHRERDISLSGTGSRIVSQGQCLAMGMWFSEREKNLFAGHLRRDFLSSRA